MIKLPPITWTHNGRSLSVSLFVEGDVVVGMTPVDGAAPASRIVVPNGAERKYLGDHVATGLSKLGIKQKGKCAGPESPCAKRQRALNNMHRKVAGILG